MVCTSDQLVLGECHQMGTACGMHVDAHGVPVQKPEGIRPLGKGGHSLQEDNTKMDFKSTVGITWLGIGRIDGFYKRSMEFGDLVKSF